MREIAELTSFRYFSFFVSREESRNFPVVCVLVFGPTVSCRLYYVNNLAHILAVGSWSGSLSMITQGDHTRAEILDTSSGTWLSVKKYPYATGLNYCWTLI